MFGSKDVWKLGGSAPACLFQYLYGAIEGKILIFTWGCGFWLARSGREKQHSEK